MTMIQLIACIGMIAGLFIQPVLQMLEQVPQLDTVLLCLDNDEAGHQASRRIPRNLRRVEIAIPS